MFYCSTQFQHMYILYYSVQYSQKIFSNHLKIVLLHKFNNTRVEVKTNANNTYKIPIK